MIRLSLSLSLMFQSYIKVHPPGLVPVCEPMLLELLVSWSDRGVLADGPATLSEIWISHVR